MTRMWRIRVDRDRCAGSGLCCATAPDAFELDADRLSRPKRVVVEASATIEDVVELCPMEAISVAELDEPGSGR